MSEGLLTVLKLCFLALLYLFLLRVVRVVVLEMRTPAAAPVAVAAPPARPTRASRARLRLRVLEPPERKGEVYDLGDELTVGRASGCSIVLADDTFVSQVHARLSAHDGDVFVEDLGSRNGTFVNGEPATTAMRLRRGDRVQFGQTVAEVVR